MNYSNPVQGPDFFGRGEIIELLKKRAAGLIKGYRQNVAILGGELMGKSSLVLRTLKDFEEMGILPIYLHLKNEGFPQFAHRFMKSLLYFSLNERKSSHKEDALSSLIEETKEKLPKTTEAMLKLEKSLKRKPRGEHLAALLSIVSLLKDESGKHYMVILDEFHLLGELGIEAGFSTFGNMIMEQNDIMYILTSSAAHRAEDILTNELSLLFGNFEVVHLEPFDFNVSTKFLNHKLNSFRARRVLKDFLILLTNGHPFYMDVLTNRIKWLLLERRAKRVTLEAITDALIAEVLNPRGILHQRMKHLLAELKEEYPSCISTLHLLSNGNGNLWSGNPSSRDRTRIKRQMDRLLYLDMLKRSGNVHVLKDPLFQLWLRWRCVDGNTSPDEFDFSHKQEKFKNNVEALFASFSKERRLGYGQRIRSLFSSFRNEVVEMEKRPLKLPHFDKVQRATPKNGTTYIFAKKRKGYWLGVVYTKRVSEDNIRVAVDDIAGLRRKINKKILLCLSGINTDAKLLAHDRGFLIWGLKEINFLLNAYGKLKIIK